MNKRSLIPLIFSKNKAIALLGVLLPFLSLAQFMGGEIRAAKIGDRLVIDLDLYKGCTSMMDSETIKVEVYPSGDDQLGSACELQLVKDEPIEYRYPTPCAMSACATKKSFRGTIEWSYPNGVVVVYKVVEHLAPLSNVTSSFETGISLKSEVYGAIDNEAGTWDMSPTLVLCQNEPVHLGTQYSDPEGDSLYYNFFFPSTASTIKENIQNPEHNNEAPSLDESTRVYDLGPPYKPIQFKADSPEALLGQGSIQKDELTNTIQIQSTQMGEYLVGVEIFELNSQGKVVRRSERVFTVLVN